VTLHTALDLNKVSHLTTMMRPIMVIMSDYELTSKNLSNIKSILPKEEIFHSVQLKYKLIFLNI